MLSKNLAVLALSFTLIAPVFAGSESGGGSDPLEIVAKPYSDSVQLLAAIKLAQDKIQASSLKDEYKDSFLSDLNALASSNKFKTLPAMIIMGGGQQDGGYELPADADRFISLGGMTKFEAGAPVYFAERVKEYTVEKLAHLVIHEVFHHILPAGLKNDEKFVELITTAVDSGVEDERIEKAFLVHGFYRKDYISRESFIKAYLDPSIHGHKVDREKMMRIRLPYHLPANLAGLSIYKTIDLIYESMRVTGSVRAYAAIDERIIFERLRTIGKVIDPHQPESSWASVCTFWSCRNDTKLGEVLSIK